MIYRKVAKFVVAAFVAAFLSVGAGGGTSAFALQSYGVGSTPCAGCSQTISFPSSNVSSMPQMASEVTYPVGQVVYSSPVTQSLPTSNFIASTPAVANTVYENLVNETYETYPPSTYASGQVIVSEGTISEPVGTLTSLPATSFAQPVAHYAPAASYFPATSVSAQPTVVQPVYYPSARSTPVRSTLSTGYQMVSNGVGSVSAGLAQMKAQQAASGRIRGQLPQNK